ncbi:MAG TPA: hypothetical protein VKT28_01710 [Puia sp.]|nr:hypothetical protein [Puia sp.]
MITSLFNSEPKVIGVNIEKVYDTNGIVICVAFRVDENYWSAKTLSGISGDIADEVLLKYVEANGLNMSEIEASNIFYNAKLSNLKYKII